MDLSINNFLKQTNNGLYLIDMPTGTGKTTKAIDYIYKHIKENKKFFFITSLNKNVDDAYNKLKERFIADNNLIYFEENVLRIYANSEVLITKFNILKIDSNDEIMKLNSFIELKNELERLNRIGNLDSSIIDIFINDIKEKYEPNFRKELRAYLKGKGKTAKERFKYIINNHKWLEDIYPAILTNYRKVFFLSLDKFYLGNDTIIEPTYKFISNNNLLENSVIFIDEIDACKSTLLSRIISDSLKNNIDLVKVFINIHNSLEIKEFPKEMLKPSINKNIRNENIINSLKEHFSYAYNRFNMKYSFKLLDKDEDKKYIFDDSEILTITNKKDVYDLFVNSDDKENYNHIMYKKKVNSYALSNVVRSLTKCIRRFSGVCYILALNYCEYYNRYLKHDGDIMLIDDAVLSVIKAFNINDRYIEYLKNLILGKNKLNQTHYSDFKTDIYDTGFKYYKFSDSLDNVFSTNISLYDVFDTPESFLLNLVSKTHVIGLSATSTMDTVTGNFDLTYLRNKLGNNFYIPTKEESKRINNEITEIINSNKSNIKVNYIESNDVNISLNKLFISDDYKNVMLNLFGYLNDTTNLFNVNRLLKVALSIKEFINSNLSSLLILTNRNLAEDDSLFSKKTFEKILSYITKEVNYTKTYEIINLTSKNFDENKKKYSKNNRKDKIIIFSSYPTTGAGQNLQYEIEENGASIEEDINALYIEKPTNILINTATFNETTKEELLKYIYQVEALRTNGEITLKDKNICIKEAFLRTNNNTYIRKHTNLYQTNSVKNQAISVLIQAVGRICRTRNKKNDTIIFIDNDIMQSLDLSLVKNRRLNKEFLAIINNYNVLFNESENEDKEVMLIRKAENSNKVLNDAIHRIVIKNTWLQSDIDLWIRLRDYVLRKPTTNDCYDNDGIFSNCYLKVIEPIDSYYYKQEEDYGYVNISLSKEKDLTSIVSEAEANLSLIIKNVEIKRFFIENGYATKFEKGNYIILPVIFNNIYKGALGETVGKYVLDKLGFKLEEITEPNLFEKFDYRYNDIYIDFKNWNNRGSSLDLNHIKDKLEVIKGNIGLIINLIGEKKENIKKNDNIYVIPNLFYLENNNLVLNKNVCDFIKGILEAKHENFN